MKTVKVKRKINQPEIVDYEKSYPTFPCELDLFDVIVDADNISRALTVVEEMGCSPVPVFESKIHKAIKDGKLTALNRYQKQFAGRAICVVMQCNGWSTTGKKQRFSKGIFSTGEVYKPTI